jgi:uncharacterized repeat protein (TIGR01451 family)
MVVPILWVLLSALALVLSWTTGAAAFAWVGYLMVTAWLVGYALARLGGRGVRAARQLSTGRLPFGGEVTVEVTVANASRVPALWVIASETLPSGLPMTGVRGRVGPLAGRDRFGFRYTLHGGRRGWYEIGPTQVRTGDLFGLVQREMPAAGTSELTVFPKTIPIQHARPPSRRPAGEMRPRQRVLEDPTQVVGVRPYQHGDGLRRVHWRATAHTGRLQSKLFEVSAQVETIIVLNLRRSDYSVSPGEAEETSELAIVAAASIAQHLLDRRERVALVVLGRDPADRSSEDPIRLRAGRGEAHLTAFLSALGRAELGPAEDLSAVLEREKEDLPWGSTVVVVTSSITEELVAAGLRLRTAGFGVRVVLVGRGPHAPLGAPALQAFGVSAERVSSEAGIRELTL